MKIYFDRWMCEEVEISYTSKGGERLTIRPKDLVLMKRSGYDKKHMDYFKKVGMETNLNLRHSGFGWFIVERLNNGQSFQHVGDL